MSLSVSILGFLPSDDLGDRVTSSISSQRHQILSLCDNSADFLNAAQGQPNPDCLIVEQTAQLSELLNQLRQQTTLLPIVILSHAQTQALPNEESQPREETGPASIAGAGQGQSSHAPHQHYHPGTVSLDIDALDQLDDAIDRAIKQFLKISPSDPLLNGEASVDSSPLGSGSFVVLQDQQRRLAEKLRERLDYLGVYYKRDARHFLRNLPQEEVTEILNNLQRQYKTIVLSYFSETESLNSAIDEFVNTAFFTDISVTKIVESHMELMDEFSKQLKLEGRSEEMLVDYRLTLLDIVAHLCEMYRRSIPRES